MGLRQISTEMDPGSTTCCIVDLPPDIIEDIVRHVDQHDLTSLARVCAFLRPFATEQLFVHPSVPSDPSPTVAFWKRVFRGPERPHRMRSLSIHVHFLPYEKTWFPDGEYNPAVLGVTPLLSYGFRFERLRRLIVFHGHHVGRLMDLCAAFVEMPVLSDLAIHAVGCPMLSMPGAGSIKGVKSVQKAVLTQHEDRAIEPDRSILRRLFPHARQIVSSTLPPADFASSVDPWATPIWRAVDVKVVDGWDRQTIQMYRGSSNKWPEVDLITKSGEGVWPSIAPGIQVLAFSARRTSASAVYGFIKTAQLGGFPKLNIVVANFDNIYLTDDSRHEAVVALGRALEEMGFEDRTGANRHPPIVKRRWALPSVPRW